VSVQRDADQRYADVYSAATAAGWARADLTALGFPAVPPSTRRRRTNPSEPAAPASCRFLGSPAAAAPPHPLPDLPAFGHWSAYRRRRRARLLMCRQIAWSSAVACTPRSAATAATRASASFAEDGRPNPSSTNLTTEVSALTPLWPSSISR